MNINPTLKYQIGDQKKSFFIFWIIMCGLLVLTFIASMILIAVYGSFDSNNDSATQIVTPFYGYYIFVASVCGIYLFFSSIGSFKENFLMMQQNSVSRKSMFVARLETIGIMSLIMTVCGLVFYYLTWAVLRIMFMIEGSQDTMALSFAEPNSNAILTLVETLCGFLLLMAIGYFITVLFYRLNKTGKILVPILVCVLLAVFSTLSSIFASAPIILALERFWILCSSSMGAQIISQFCFAAAFMLVSWLLIRRAPVKRTV